MLNDETNLAREAIAKRQQSNHDRMRGCFAQPKGTDVALALADWNDQLRQEAVRLVAELDHVRGLQTLISHAKRLCPTEEEV